MKNVLYLLLLLSTSTPSLLAQSSYLKLFYELPPDVLENKLKYGFTLTPSDCKVQVGTLSDKNKLAAGYYILAEVQEEELWLSIVDRTTMYAVLLNNQRDFAVQIIDTSGNVINFAKVFLDGKLVPFDKTTNSYRIPKHKKGKLLRVEALEQVAFFMLDVQDLTKNNRRFRNTRLGSIALTPVRWTKNTYKFFYRGISNNYWHIYWQNLVPHWLIPEEKDYPAGYIATNQPLYRHGDTLKIKAYTTKPNGKPLKKGVELKITAADDRKTLFDSILYPDLYGNVLYEMRLDDSLTLDKRYAIEITTVKNNRYHNGLYRDFKLEDYQLDEVNYSFAAAQFSYRKGDKIVLLADGKDENNQYVADAAVQLIATVSWAESSDELELYIPDTLWNFRQPLDPNQETQIIFPDSLLPNATINVYLTAIFTNSNGELQQESTSFNYISERRNNQMILENGYIKVNSFEYNKSIGGSAILKKFVNNTEITTPIQLPYTERYNPAWSMVYLTDEKNTLLNTLYPESEIEVYGEHLGDSVIAVFNNPHQVPINYWLFKGEHLLQKGQSEAPRFLVQEKKADKTVYFLKYQYLWKGISNDKNLKLEHLKNKLDIEVETPTKVQPGEQVQVKVKIKDVNNQPVKGVNLLAGAVNAQFDELNTFSDINISNKRSKPLKKFANFEMEQLNDSNFKYPLTWNWYAPFALKEQFYYAMRSAKSAIFTQYDSITNDSSFKRIAQFAPYVFKNGLSQPVIMIYINKKLCYYYETSQYHNHNQQPYSFVGRPGYNNQIIIRTPEYEYVLDNVLLKAGHKLELAIQENYFLPNNNLSRTVKPNFLLPAEKKLLESTMLFLSNVEPSQDYFMWQDSNEIKHVRIQARNASTKTQPIMVGPFSPSSHIYFLKSNYFGKNLEFEPGFVYDVKPTQDRLYESDHFQNKQLFPAYLPPLRPKQLVIKPSSIKYVQVDTLINPIFRLAYSYQPKEAEGKYQFNYQDDKGKYLKAIAMVHSNGIKDFFRPDDRKINTLKPGSYTLIFLNQHYEFFKKRVVIKKDSLLYHNFVNINWQKDTTGEIRTIFYFTPQYKNKQEFEKQFEVPFYGENRIIWGKVMDSEGEPLIGASVFIRGTSLGTVTDIDGSYRLFIPSVISSPTLVVSYTGFATIESNISGNSNQDFLLQASLSLDEIVVTGYGVNKEISATSSIALQGRTAGISITEMSALVRDSAQTLNLSQRLSASDEAESLSATSSTASIRSNFKDYAYWKPNLRSDHKGETYFSVTYPDNITSWNTYVVGVDKKKRAGIHYGNTKAFKSVMAQLAVPQFLIQGDTTHIIGKTINYTNDTVTLQTNFEINGTPLVSRQFDVINGSVERLLLETATAMDTAFVTYKMQMNNIVDGEKRAIPVLANGIEQSKGIFVVLNKDTAFSITPILPEGTLMLRIEGSLLQTLVSDIEYLKKYPYGCNEQNASRLLAFLMSKQIAKQLKQPFEEEKWILSLIQKLEKSQNTDGAWGWWQGNTSSDWMTIYITKILQIANENNYKSKSLEKATQYLALQFDKLPNPLQVDALEVLAKSTIPFNFQTPLARLDTVDLDLHHKLSLIKVKQILQRSYTLDILYKYQQKTVFGGVFLQEKNYDDYISKIKNTLLAYQILKQANQTTLLPAIQQYFFEARNAGTGNGWMNTYLTAQVLYLILPDFLASTPAEALMQETCKVNNQTVNGFPYQAIFSGKTPLEIEKTGKSPLFLTVYQQAFVRNPAAKSDIFKIKSFLLQNNQTVTKLALPNNKQLL